VNNNPTLVTIFNRVVLEEASRTVMKLMEVKAILAFDSSLATFFNPHISFTVFSK
jgi:hypothetical protein